MAAIQINTSQMTQIETDVNRPFAPILIDPATMIVDKIEMGGYLNFKQQIFACIRYKAIGGGEYRTKKVKFERYNIDAILGQFLEREEHVLILPCVDTSLTSIIVAIEQACNILLTTDDIIKNDTNGNYVHLTCLVKSLGWFGDFSIKVVN